MALEDEMPPWMERRLAASVARSARNFCAARIRRKLVNETSAETLLAEAFEMVRRDIGPFPSEDNPTNDPFPDDNDDSTERDTHEIALRNFESLSETEAYMWGLGIAGVFHQWERDTRFVIAAPSEKPPTPKKLETMDFRALCKEVRKTGFAIAEHASFATLRLSRLLANTIKHGSGESYRVLAVERPDLFHGGPVSVHMRNLPAQPHHLRVSEPHFDDIVAVIDRIWGDYECQTAPTIDPRSASKIDPPVSWR
jgi:hypothetical protein